MCYKVHLFKKKTPSEESHGSYCEEVTVTNCTDEMRNLALQSEVMKFSTGHVSI